MKSLKESILSSNDIGVRGILKDLMHDNKASKEGLKKLNKLWKDVKLDLPDYKWHLDDSLDPEWYEYYVDKDLYTIPEKCWSIYTWYDYLKNSYELFISVGLDDDNPRLQQHLKKLDDYVKKIHKVFGGEIKKMNRERCRYDYIITL